MEKNYSDFREISIYDTGLIRKSSYVAGVFKKNNIETLEELFQLDDNLGINYGANTVSATYGTYKHVRSQIHGIIKLIRHKYLNEDLFVDTLYDNIYNLESEYFKDTYIPSDPSTYPPRFSKFLNSNPDGEKINIDFKDLGFSDNEIEIFCRYTYKINGNNFEFGSMFLDVANGILENMEEYNRRMFANKAEQSIFIEKIRLVSDYIKKDNKLADSTDISSKELIEEEKRLIAELSELNDRSSKILSRINEIQDTLKSDKGIRR